MLCVCFFIFCFNAPSTSEIYPLSLHDALPISVGAALVGVVLWGTLSGAMLPFLLRRFGLDPATSSAPFVATLADVTGLDRKSTRLNSSHVSISYAVFCLKKKK